MRSEEEIKKAIESLNGDIDRYTTDMILKDDDIKSIIRSCIYRINALQWVLLERTTWL